MSWKDSISEMELGGTYCKKDRRTLDQKDHELETRTNQTTRQITGKMEKWNRENSRHKMATSGNGSFEMEGNWEGLHPAVDRNRLKKKKKKKKKNLLLTSEDHYLPRQI